MAHLSVLLDPVLDLLAPLDRLPDRVLDGTLGAGGHSRALLERGAGELLGLDLDPQALAIARETLLPFSMRVHIAQNSYANMGIEAERIGWRDGVDAILLDLGVSSMQFDTPARGFAFRYDAPLDMRFDPDGLSATAADLVNTLDEGELADLFYEYGEERDSRRIARAVVHARPLLTTQQLATVVEKATPRRHDAKIHPATRVFRHCGSPLTTNWKPSKRGFRRDLTCCAHRDGWRSSAFTAWKIESSRRRSAWRRRTASARPKRRFVSAITKPVYNYCRRNRSWRIRQKSRRTRAAAAPD